MAKMNPDLVKRAIEVVHTGDPKAALDMLKEWVGAMCSGGSDDAPDSGDDPGSEGDGAEGVPSPKKSKAEQPKVVAGLTAAQIKICREAGCDPTAFLTVRAAFDGEAIAARLRASQGAADAGPPLVPGVFGGDSTTGGRL
jgi:hypothetical protein